MNFKVFRSLEDGHTYAIIRYSGGVGWLMVTAFIVGSRLFQVHVN